MHATVCAWCEAQVTDNGAAFCGICGNSFSATGRGTGMIYKNIRVNENGKALTCPHCENEELSVGDYCKICGNDIINRCADTQNPKAKNLVNRSCGSILQGNARYCSRCGNESTFYQKGWLMDWKSENTKKAIYNVSGTHNTIHYKEIKDEA